MEDRIITYGGQAVMEGVLMRGQKALAIAMRAPSGEIVIHTEKLVGLYQSKLTKVPFVRGVILLWDALGLGMKALTISANVQTGEDEKLEGWQLYLTLAFSLTLSVGLFFMLPAALGGWMESLLVYFFPPAGATGGAMFSLTAAPAVSGWYLWVGNLTEGLVRLGLLVGYIWSVGKVPDIHRVFQYHGAEHKTINAFEAGAELTPENVAKFPLEHPRCGTAFILTLVLLSIVIYSILGPMPMLWRLASRLLLLPLLAGIAVEYIRWTANHLDSPFVRWMIKPNMALQRLTTSEPDLQMLEVSIRSFNEMMKLEKEEAAG